MRPADAARFARTIRHLRPAQVAGQLARALHGAPHAGAAKGPAPRLRAERAATPFLPPAEHVRASTARSAVLLNRSLPIGEGAVDWSFAREGPLFAFHLHYHDWLRADGIAPAEREALLRDWIARHRTGTGWHPATISERVFVWTRLLLTPDALPRDDSLRNDLARSLADQLATLAPRLERDLLANHYLFNLLALVLGGVLVEGAEAPLWLRAADALRRELAEQILPDGMHFERSPMYHALVLERVLDVLNVASAAPGRLPAALDADLRSAASRMLWALSVLTHPDGDIALLGDSAFGIAAPHAQLAAYAARLGVRTATPVDPGLLAHGGFVRLAAGPFVLIASIAGPMPAYQPGHAHCDALSFELSVGAQRVVADTGVCEYVPGARRTLARATRAHATIEIDGEEQAELWGAHRVGGRPRVEIPVRVSGGALEATCRGWSRPRVEARRRFEVGPREVRIDDRVSGRARSVRLRLPLAPEVEAELDGTHARLRLPDGTRLVAALPEAARWRVERMPYYPEFGRERERACLVGEAESLAAGAWRFALDPRANG